MANSLQVNTSQPVAGLGDFEVTVLTAGNYQVECQTFLPWAPAGSSNETSDVEILIKQNSSTLLTIGGVATNPTATQPIMNASYNVACAANDVIHVVLSSSNAVDSIPNNVKSIITISQGI